MKTKTMKTWMSVMDRPLLQMRTQKLSKSKALLDLITRASCTSQSPSELTVRCNLTSPVETITTSVSTN